MDLAVSHTTMYLFGIMWSYEQNIILLGWGLLRHFCCAFMYCYFVTFLYHHNSMELPSIVYSISIQTPASDVPSAPLCLFVIHPWTAQLGGKEVPWPGILELKATPHACAIPPPPPTLPIPRCYMGSFFMWINFWDLYPSIVGASNRLLQWDSTN